MTRKERARRGKAALERWNNRCPNCQSPICSGCPQVPLDLDRFRDLATKLEREERPQ